MNRILTLTQIMMKSSSYDFTQQLTTKKKKTSKMMMVLFGFIFVYLGVIVYFLWNSLIEKSIQLGQSGITIYTLFTTATLYILIMGIMIVPGVFYFSKDIERYLVLPVKPSDILFSKFITSLITMYITASIIFIPFAIAYIVNVKPDILFILRFILGSIMIPIIPFTLALIFMIIILTFIPFFKNKDVYTYCSTGIAVILGLGIAYFGQSSGSGNTDYIANLMASITSGDNALLKVMNTALPTITMLARGVVYADYAQLGLGIVFSIIIPFILVTMVQKLYFNGVIGIDESSSNKVALSQQELKNKSKRSSPLRAVMRYDIRNILRTPVFTTNYFSGLIILPVMIFMPLLIGISKAPVSLSEITLAINEVMNITFYSQSGLTRITIVAIIGLMIAYFMANIGLISATSISREGRTLQQFQSMPINLMTVVQAKILIGACITVIPTWVVGIIISLLIRLNIGYIIIFMISAVIGSMISNTSAVVLDVFAPKLIWDNETQAIKQNFLTMVPLFTSFVIIGLFIVALFNFNPITVIYSFGIGLIIYTLITYQLIKLFVKNRLPKVIEQI